MITGEKQYHAEVSALGLHPAGIPVPVRVVLNEIYLAVHVSTKLLQDACCEISTLTFIQISVVHIVICMILYMVT